jgi:hypothetical protein
MVYTSATAGGMHRRSSTQPSPSVYPGSVPCSECTHPGCSSGANLGAHAPQVIHRVRAAPDMSGEGRTVPRGNIQAEFIAGVTTCSGWQTGRTSPYDQESTQQSGFSASGFSAAHHGDRLLQQHDGLVGEAAPHATVGLLQGRRHAAAAIQPLLCSGRLRHTRQQAAVSAGATRSSACALAGV